MGSAISLLESLCAFLCVVSAEVWAVVVSWVAWVARERTVVVAVWWWRWLHAGVGGWWGRSDVEGLTVGTLRVASTLAEDPVRLITRARLVSCFVRNSRRITYHKITVATGWFLLLSLIYAHRAESGAPPRF